MSKFQSLADFLGNPEGSPSEFAESSPEPTAEDRARAEAKAKLEAEEREEVFSLEKMTGEEFADAILNSRIFRRYIIDSMRLGTIPASVLNRLMDCHPEWAKQPDRIEHTGKDGQPIETVTIVRRVIVRSPNEESEDVVHADSKYPMH
jgi:hypothetical protein